MLLGSGGAPEGVLSSTALKNLDGEFQGSLLWKNSAQKQRALKMGLKDPDQIFTRDQLAQGDCIFCASAVTSNPPFKRGSENSRLADDGNFGFKPPLWKDL